VVRRERSKSDVAFVRYISHPESAIDPDVAVGEWALSARGLDRARRCLDQPWVSAITRIVTSPEGKAIEMATVLGDHLQIPIETRNSTTEIDRSSTGFVPPDEHERLADRLFAEPQASARGWETADHAQARIVSAVADLLESSDSGDIAIVGHGGVGTLLMCWLADLPIDRVHDQPGQGHYWTYDITHGRMLHQWKPIDPLDT
jgi:broad specificity phosphatase PhoE